VARPTGCRSRCSGPAAGCWGSCTCRRRSHPAHPTGAAAQIGGPAIDSPELGDATAKLGAAPRGDRSAADAGLYGGAAGFDGRFLSSLKRVLRGRATPYDYIVIGAALRGVRRGRTAAAAWHTVLAVRGAGGRTGGSTVAGPLPGGAQGGGPDGMGHSNPARAWLANGRRIPEAPRQGWLGGTSAMNAMYGVTRGHARRLMTAGRCPDGVGGTTSKPVFRRIERGGLCGVTRVQSPPAREVSRALRRPPHAAKERAPTTVSGPDLEGARFSPRGRCGRGQRWSTGNRALLDQAGGRQPLGNLSFARRRGWVRRIVIPRGSRGGGGSGVGVMNAGGVLPRGRGRGVENRAERQGHTGNAPAVPGCPGRRGRLEAIFGSVGIVPWWTARRWATLTGTTPHDHDGFGAAPGFNSDWGRRQTTQVVAALADSPHRQA